MEQNNLILISLLVFFNLFFYKYFLVIINKFKRNLLVDNQFKKPQAFHEFPVSTSGGLGLYFSFLILYFYLLLFNQAIYNEYLSFCTLFFLLGFSDDLKLNIRPKFRLIVMIFFLIILIITSNLQIENTGIKYLNQFLKIDIFSLFFMCLCFLFIINGSNLIDGYNGLLSIHILIILTNLLFVNFFNENFNFAFFIFCSILIITIFLIYNFPRAKVFLGDSGSYFLGAFVAITIIKTSILNPTISPFYFCILLFYLFFEVFFSFFRKIIKEKKSPLFPDEKHLHMLIYKNLLIKNNSKFKSNYSVSIIINSAYFLLTIPAIFMMENGMFCKYYSLLFFAVYLLSYKFFYEKK
tara:strand:- start:556 stop:1611 length:1056 start_codon:yes stop_codon:yes gene_type:complete